MKHSPTAIRRITKHASIYSLMAILILVGCVTVNVNFPESAVQQATDDYVNSLYGEKRTPRTKSAPQEPDKDVTPPPAEDKPTSFFELIPSAYALDFSVHTDSPKAKTIFERLKSKIPELRARKKDGILGESKNGYLRIRDEKSLQPLEKKKLQNFVDEENNLRNDLYKEVLNYNQMNKNDLDKVEESFARSFQRVSPTGTWVEDNSGKWSRKE